MYDAPDPQDGREFCPFCSQYCYRIEVAGHTQCDNCKQVIETCCGG